MSIIQNLTSNRPVVQVDGRIIKQNASESQESLRSLETGERLSGKIISMTDEGGVKNAQIRLGDDMVISAKLQDGMNLREGQVVSFEVRGVSNQITLTPLYENTAVDPTTLKALNAAGIEVNQDTVNMVKSMMENGMGIDKNSLNTMHDIINSHPNTDASTLVQMKALDIPINEQNVLQFESYKNYEHQVVETMNSIMDDLPEAYNQLVQNGEGKAANDLYGGILDMLSKGAEQMEQMTVGKETAVIPEGNMANPEVANTNTSNTGTIVMQEQGMETGEANTNAAVEAETVKAEAETGDTLLKATEAGDNTLEKVNPEAADNSEAKINPETGEKVAVKDMPETTENAVLKGSPEAAEGAQKGASLHGEPIQGQAPKAEAPTITLSNNFANIIKELNTNTGTAGPQMQKLIAQLQSDSPAKIDQTALLKELAEAYTSSAHSSEGAEKAFTKLFGNNEYNKLMKSIMQDEWLLKPDDVSVKENVQNLYERLNAQAKQLTQQLTTALGSDSKVAQSAANLQNNIDFMNQLNQMFHYVQLPLKMADQEAHGDLYVYSNGKRKFEPGDTVSAILHLDMDNLGPLDVYVKMKDNNVKTNFYVADESVIDLIAEHIDELSDRLNKRGYNMEARMMLHTDQDTDSEDPPVEAILDAKKTAFLSMTSFDARA
ncbi:flagellar hook-length control protein FliK [Butyrivibrio sp. AC2005]|uniref:flagellar hook-length control protein FliK n=1 Tax=Butyrivibrio sp. AC2005 TaxID=1280672 RepID=UPI000407F4D2|nr:flagellar hook-length control protein FliK [Butyrivibrio sp. AC2005]